MKKELITLLKAVGITAIFCILIAVSVAVMLRLGVWASQRAYIYRNDHRDLLAALYCFRGDRYKA